MAEKRHSARMRSATGSGRASSRIGSAGSVALTPPRSPATNRVPSSYLIKQVETPPNPSKWQRQHEQSTFRQLSFHRENKKVAVRESKQKAQKLARKIPTELLAKEWMSDNQITLDARAYLVENILPTLILGLEKLLMEADKRELTESGMFDANFNPVNYLAQYLMRNNPRYSNLSEASPYVKSLREIGETLKAQIFQLEDNKLARIKNEARRKREEREKAAEQRKFEQTRRTQALEEQFLEWTENEDGKVEMALVQSTLKSFEDMIEYLPEELQSKAKYSQKLDPTDDTGRTMICKEFVEYLSGYIDDFPTQLFDQFTTHLTRCAKAYHAELLQEQRKTTLTNLFVMCDNSGVGVLDRHRILSLFESFYDKQSDAIKQTMRLRNPRTWPVVEVDEADSDYSDDEDVQQSGTKIQPIAEDVATAEESQPAASEQGSDSKDRPASVEEKHEEESSEKTASGEKKDETAEPADAESKESTETATVEGAASGESAELPSQSGANAAAESSTADSKVFGVDDVDTPDGAVKPPQTDQPSTDQEQAPTATDQDQAPAPAPTEQEPVLTEQAPVPTEQEPIASDPTTTNENETAPTENVEPSKSGEQPQVDQVDSEKDSGANVPAKESDDQDGKEKTMDLETDKRLATRGGAYSVSFAEGLSRGINRERTLLETRGTGSQSQMSAFDENTINMPQFVQLTETFLGGNPALDLFQALCKYMRDGYVETEEEKMARLMKAHKEVQLMKQRARVDGLFGKWDNEGSGYLDMEEIETIAHKYKDGLERQAINRAKSKFMIKTKQQTGQSEDRVTKSEFRNLIFMICEEIPGDSSFDFFVDFIETCVERTYAEKIRGEARKKWLLQIVNSAETCAASLEVVYRSVFQALYRDAETHGSGKIISANITTLENNIKYPMRGEFCLRYTAATSDDSPFLLNQILYKDMRGISFAAVENGKPLHVPRVSNHGNIQFWNAQREEEDRIGSFVVIPLKDKRKRVFGTLGVDTLRDPHSKSIFITHEIQFYQGVAKAYSIAYHNVDTKRKTLRITESAITWIMRRSETIHEVNVYLVEPDGKDEDYVLRRMMLAHGDKAEVKTFDSPSRLERKDNLFRDYLFKCVDNSETVTADAYGQRHFAFPLRGSDGRAVAIIDISTGENKMMPKHEKKEILRMLKLVQQAQKEITKERMQGEKTVVLEAEKENEDVRVEIMFDRLMLMDLRKNVAKLDARSYAELKSYSVPPQGIHNIVKSTLSLFYPEKAASNAFDDWHTCKMMINSDLNNKIANFDPTAEGAENIPSEEIGAPIKDLPHGFVSKHSSLPAEYLYNWIFVCLSLIQHTKRMRLSEANQEKARPMLPTGMTPDLSRGRDEDE